MRYFKTKEKLRLGKETLGLNKYFISLNSVMPLTNKNEIV